MWKSRIAVGALLVFVATGAVAADGMVDAIDKATQEFDNAMRAFDGALHTLWGNPLRGVGIKLLAAIAAAIACWTILKSMFMQGSSQSLLGELMQLALVASVAGAIFGAWPGTFWIKDISESILWVGNQINNGVGNGHGVDTTLTLTRMQNQGGGGPEVRIMKKMFFAAYDAWKIKTADGPSVTLILMPLDIAGRFVIGVLGKLITSLVLLIAGAVAAGTIIIAKVALACGIALAPVLVPWVLLPATKDIFSHWLGFVNSATFTIVFLQLFSSIAQLVVDNFDKVAQGTNTINGDFALYGVLIIISSVVAFLMFQAGSWARALVPGGVAVGVAGLLAPAAMAAKGAATVANPAAGAAVKLGGAALAGAKEGWSIANKSHTGVRAARAMADKMRALPTSFSKQAAMVGSKAGGVAQKATYVAARPVGVGSGRTWRK